MNEVEEVFKPRGIVPTEEQRAIQCSRDPYVIVEANAGAAKTTTLALRLAQALAQGIPPGALLALTYTEPACRALDDALRRLGVTGPERGRMRIQTFERFAAAMLLRVEGARVPTYDTAEQVKPMLLRAVERVVGNADEKYPEELNIPGSGDAIVEATLKEFLHLKGTLQLNLEGDGQALTPHLAAELDHDYATLRIFAAYERDRLGGNPDQPRFRAEGDATYDLAILLLDDGFSQDERHPLALGAQVIAVDEMHDMNRAMFTVLKSLLTRNRRAAFVGVGDRDQVIHAVAGADALFMGTAFDAEIGRAKRLPLGGSYRFGKHLARVAGRVANKPYTSHSERNTQVKVLACADAAAAVQAIVSAAQAREGLEKKAPLSQVAVLLRHPYQSVGIENGLLDAGIPYAADGFTSYLLRPEVLLIRGLLAYADDDFKAIESSDTRALVARALLLFGGATLEVRGREATDPEALLKEACHAVAENPRLLKVFFENQVLRTGSPPACQRLKAAVEAARSQGGGDVLGRMVAALQPQWLAAQVLVQSWRVRQVAGNIAGLVAMAGGYGGAHDFFIALNAFEVRQRSLKAKDSLTLASIEAAKGLEFDHVMMPFINAREFAVEGDSTDERNLFYVGITRARNQLTLLHEVGRASRYLVEAGVVVDPNVAQPV